MSVKVFSVEKGSPLAKKRVKKGDLILKINGNLINDVLDFDFYASDEKLIIEVQKANGKLKTLKIKKQEYEPLGAEFETYLMDKQHCCTNKCIFCFVDQLPEGMRESLYFKDDDDRLSFLFGNYVTLTNMPESEIERIIKMHISPINISVHTTNPKLRCEMMNNRFAGDVLKYIDMLAKGGIKLNCQLVLCPGINDGEELRRSLNDLGRLYPQVSTIACVPLGMTKFREGLTKLEPYNEKTANEAIDIIEEFSAEFYEKHGARIAYPADEFYIKAKRPVPDYDFYGDFDQLDNGVGMIALQKKEFEDELSEIPECETVRRITVATGVDAAPFIQNLVDELKIKWHNLECRVKAIQNDFFGHSITVAGLVTGGDLINQLKGLDLGDELLIPSCMLRHERDVFLDDVSLVEVEERLNIKVTVTENDGAELLHALIGR